MTKQDWRNPEDYRYLDDAEDERWAWEFLRRSEDYRRDYEKYHDYPTTDDIGKFKNRPDFGDYYVGKPEINPNESYDEYIKRCRLSESNTKIQSVRAKISEKYYLGYNDLPDPDSTELPDFYFPYFGLFEPELDYGEEHAIAVFQRNSCDLPYEDSYNIACYFNLTYPLPVQIRIASAKLEKLQKCLVKIGEIDLVNERARRSNYPLYVRLLDALKDKATESVILNTLYVDDRSNAERNNLIDNKTAAHELANGKYKMLLYKD